MGKVILITGLIGCCVAPLAQMANQKWLFVLAVSVVSMQLGANQVYAGPLIVYVFGKPNMATMYGLILIGVAFASIVGPVCILAPTAEYVRASEDAKYDTFFYTSAGVLAAALGSMMMVSPHYGGPSTPSISKQMAHPDVVEAGGYVQAAVNPGRHSTSNFVRHAQQYGDDVNGNESEAVEHAERIGTVRPRFCPTCETLKKTFRWLSGIALGDILTPKFCLLLVISVCLFQCIQFLGKDMR